MMIRPIRHRGQALLWLAVIGTGVAVIAAGVLAWWQPWTSHDDEAHAHEEGGDTADASADYYTCGMHPWVILPHEGECPICHMALTPLDPAKFTGEVAIDPVVVQNIGVRVSPVTAGTVTRTLRTVGTVDYDESRVRELNIKVAGWVEKLHVDATGDVVRQGEPLFELYSPDLYTAQEEFLLARRHNNADLLEAARTRLSYFDLSPEQIDAIAEAGKPTRTLPVLSPFDGVVIEKSVTEGMRLEPGTRTYRFADLSQVWVRVTLYEVQVPFVEVGQRAVMRLPYLPERTFEGEVAYIYPYLDRQNREVQVRLVFDNPDGLLKPGMFAEVTLESTLPGERVLAPRSAVIDTGTRQVAFVSLGQGRFEPRDVTMGVEAQDGLVEIREGLEPGEQVVTSGQFLLDSEARMREALAKMITGTPAVAPATQPAADAPRLQMPDANPDATPYPLDVCLVTDLKLGSMGEPIVGVFEGQEIKFCCAACPPQFEANPQQYLEKLERAADPL